MYEAFIREAEQHGIYIYEKPLKPRTKGLQADNVIWINKNMSNTEKTCVVAEELGHYHTSVGNILDQTKTVNRKQEKRARTWAHKKLIPLHKIVQAHKEGIRNRHELADFLDITEEFLEEAIIRYREIYGIHTTFQGYTLCFDPLGVIEMFE